MRKTTLGLELPTSDLWVEMTRWSIEDILIDHAWCEQKAASSCISLILLFHDFAGVVQALTPVVSEEWQHFRRVLAELGKRGLVLKNSKPDPYVIELSKLERKGGSRPTQLMEKLLINALIEARSAEKFKLLHRSIPDPELKNLYFDLMISESGHYRLFLDLAMEHLSEELVRDRWSALVKMESEIMSRLGVSRGRFH